MSTWEKRLGQRGTYRAEAKPTRSWHRGLEPKGAAILFPLAGAHRSACSVNHGSGRVLARGEAVRKLAHKQDRIDDEMAHVQRTLGGVVVARRGLLQGAANGAPQPGRAFQRDLMFFRKPKGLFFFSFFSFLNFCCILLLSFPVPLPFF